MVSPLQIADICSIIVGIFGALINTLLFWVSNEHHGIKKKFAFLFRNLALNDFVSSIAIPTGWFLSTPAGALRDLVLNDPELAVISISLCIVCVQHALISMVAFLRYKILIGEDSYREFTFKNTKRYVVLVWFICYVIPLLACVCSIIVDKRSEALSVLPIVTSIMFIIGLSSACMILLLLLSKLSKIILLNWTLPISSIYSIKVSLLNVFLILLFTITFSMLPVIFCLEMIACGPKPENVSPNSTCSHLREAILQDVKLEFSVMFLSLCLMSLSNAAVFLLQPSLRVKFLSCLCCKSLDSDEMLERLSEYIVIDHLDLMKQEIAMEKSPTMPSFLLENPLKYGSINQFTGSTLSMKSTM